MVVKVCDELCGAGKTQSCINMMNNDAEKKYIFITPYLVCNLLYSGFVSPVFHSFPERSET